MCLLVYKQPNVTIPLASAVRGGTTNSDGFGLAYHDGTRWQLHHTMDLLEHCRVLPTITAYPALVHYRLATHGTVSLDNCHPFLVGAPDDPNAFVVAHNGMFSNLPRDAQRSDTKLMVDHVFKHLRPGWADDAVLCGQLSQLFGSFNKVAVLFADGTRVLFGEQHGHWEPNEDETLKQGVWYSNAGYRDYRRYVSTHQTPTTIVTVPPTTIVHPRAGVAGFDRVTRYGVATTETIGFARFQRKALESAYCVDCWDEAGRQAHAVAFVDISKREVVTYPNTYGRYACGECGRSLAEALTDMEKRFSAAHAARSSFLETIYGD